MNAPLRFVLVLMLVWVGYATWYIQRPVYLAASMDIRRSAEPLPYLNYYNSNAWNQGAWGAPMADVFTLQGFSSFNCENCSGSAAIDSGYAGSDPGVLSMPVRPEGANFGLVISGAMGSTILENNFIGYAPMMTRDGQTWQREDIP